MLYFTIQNRLQDGTSKVSEAAGARWRFYPRISSDIVGYPRISSDYRRIVFLLAEAFREFPLKSWASRFRGRRSIWWGWRVTLLAPRIGNDVWKWRRSLMTFILRGRRSIWWGWRVTLLPPRIGNDVSYVTQIIMTFILRGRRSIWWGWRVTLLPPRIGNEVSYVTQIIDDIHFAWQAQYLVRLQGAFACSAHWKWRLICVADHWWHSFCVAGAAVGEVGGCLLLLRALEMLIHMWCGSLTTLSLCGRRSIW